MTLCSAVVTMPSRINSPYSSKKRAYFSGSFLLWSNKNRMTRCCKTSRSFLKGKSLLLLFFAQCRRQCYIQAAVYLIRALSCSSSLLRFRGISSLSTTPEKQNEIWLGSNFLFLNISSLIMHLNLFHADICTLIWPRRKRSHLGRMSVALVWIRTFLQYRATLDPISRLTSNMDGFCSHTFTNRVMQSVGHQNTTKNH